MATPPVSVQKAPLATGPLPNIRNIVIEASGDLTIRIYNPNTSGDFTSALNPEEKTTGTLLASFSLSSKVLIDKSIYFKRLLTSGYSETGKQVIDLGEKNLDAIELWFRIFHDKLVDASYATEIDVVWGVMEVANTYDLYMEELNAWFEAWMVRRGGEDLEGIDFWDSRKLAYPCEKFDYAKGFAYVTKKAVYECKRAWTERNLRWNLHLSSRIIGGINAAKGSLRTRLESALNKVGFFAGTCACRNDGHFAYYFALHKTGVWPLQHAMHNEPGGERHTIYSLQEILSRLGSFTYESPNPDCELCGRDYKAEVVEPAIKRFIEHFDGLCLDCVDRPKARDDDYDYWLQQRGGKFDEGCRIKHGDPSCYHSWTSRRDRQNAAERAQEKREQTKRDRTIERSQNLFSGGRPAKRPRCN